LPITVEQLYKDLWGNGLPEFEERLKASLHPRSSSMLYDLFAGFGVSPGQTVADVGCRDAGHAVELAKRFGCRVMAIDLIPLHLEWARRAKEEAGLQAEITVMLGRMEDLSLPDESIDHIWCRDVTSLVDLPRGFAECRRVLKPGGQMLVYQTFATEFCEPNEFRFLCESMAIMPENMSQIYFEEAAEAAGLGITQKDEIGSEWRERWLEEGDADIPASLLRVARMRRQKHELIREFGEERYNAVYGSDLWGVYQLLGKLCPTVYLLRKPKLMQ
jgi:cyclopropane fatty-acyl-phospholipid synthase-like methyltransferase